MATSIEHQDLIEDIKRPTRIYRITVWGWGGELVYGESSKEEHDYWNSDQAKQDIDLSEDVDNSSTFSVYIFEQNDEGALFPKVPERFQKQVEWYELDSIDHCTGVSADNFTMEITEVSDTSWDSNSLGETLVIDEGSYSDFGITINTERSQAFDHRYVVYAMSVEKGTFFDSYIETVGKIDLKNLSLMSTRFPNGEHLIHDIVYNNEYVDNVGLDTNGKSMCVEILDLLQNQ